MEGQASPGHEQIVVGVEAVIAAIGDDIDVAVVEEIIQAFQADAELFGQHRLKAAADDETDFVVIVMVRTSATATGSAGTAIAARSADGIIAITAIAACLTVNDGTLQLVTAGEGHPRRREEQHVVGGPADAA